MGEDWVEGRRQRDEGNPNPPERNPNFSERNPSPVEQIPNPAEWNPNSNHSISFAFSKTYVKPHSVFAPGCSSVLRSSFPVPPASLSKRRAGAILRSQMASLWDA